jgi:hypothetical protein
MFGSSIVDFAISICFIYFVFSIIASSVVEALSATSKVRAKALKAYILSFAGPTMTEAMYKNPVLDGLTPNEIPILPLLRDAWTWIVSFGRKSGQGHAATKGLPTYIPSDAFAKVLLDAASYIAQTQTPQDIASLRSMTRALAAKQAQPEHYDRVADLLNTMAVESTSISQLLTDIGKWFDSSMVRLTGQFKRRTQINLFLLGLLIAAGWNANAVMIAQKLWASSSAKAIATAASTIAGKSDKGPQEPTAQDAAKAIHVATDLSLPFGWTVSSSGPGAGTATVSSLPELFVCYSQQDPASLQEFLAHFKPFEKSGRLTAWADTKLKPGSLYEPELQRHLKGATAAVVLASSRLLRSDGYFLKNEWPLIKDKAAVFWYPLDKFDWEGSVLRAFEATSDPTIQVQALPDDKRGQALDAICKKIADREPDLVSGAEGNKSGQKSEKPRDAGLPYAVSLADLQTPGIWPLTLVGWLITALMISLGAPFWFDLLGKASNLRGVGTKPPDSTQTDSSKPAGT